MPAPLHIYYPHAAHRMYVHCMYCTVHICTYVQTHRMYVCMYICMYICTAGAGAGAIVSALASVRGTTMYVCTITADMMSVYHRKECSR
ncbi:hypothetical protein K504DRAFT_204981 [Pleomassaria siparia CBS 279.74]|uniref:Uncharacterized protein n=1 Tax=Pleomassaria siparia CBS 279.74 TaxID=1314801 RepID=A0A6G1KI22_9PLEO|nr:hypothetical protein K504DRAFT_204981 [Pleomassaria siparia CBS 279.74]